ncbi:MAG: LytTR family DNA-binding domain-containing protein, partial [Bacteroidota bacterium]
KRLNPQFFFRSHRSTIIHLREVRGTEQVDRRHSIILLNQGYKARLSQGRKALFQARLGAG